MKVLRAASSATNSSVVSVTESIGSILVRKLQVKNLKKLFGFSTRASTTTKCKATNDRSSEKCDGSSRIKEYKLPRKVDSNKCASDVDAKRQDPVRAENQDSSSLIHGLLSYPLIDSRRKGYQNVCYSSEISLHLDDCSSSNTNTEKYLVQSTQRNESYSRVDQIAHQKLDPKNKPKIVYNNTPKLNLAQTDEYDRSTLQVVKRAFSNVCKLPISPETPKDFMCRTSYRKSSDSTQVTTLSSSSSQQINFDSPRIPFSDGSSNDKKPELRTMLIHPKVKYAINPAPATSTMKESLSLSSMPPLALEFTHNNEPSFEEIFGIDRQKGNLCDSVHEKEINELPSENTRAEYHYNCVDNFMVNDDHSIGLFQTEKIYREVFQHKDVKKRAYYNLCEDRAQKSKLYEKNEGNSYENLFPTLDLRSKDQLSTSCSESPHVSQQARSVECRFDPGIVFSTLEIILEAIQLVQTNLQSVLTHFTQPSCEILAVQERKMLTVRRYIANLLGLFDQFQQLLSKVPQRLSNMRYLLLPCNNSLNELCEYLQSMKNGLIESQRYFNESITLTLLKMYSVIQVLSNVVSRGKRSFIRSVLSASTNQHYPFQVYDLNDRSKKHLQPFVELLVRRMEVLEQLRKLSRRVSNEWDSVTTWEEFLPSLYSFIGTIRVLTPYLSPEADDDFWSLAKLLPKTNLPSALDHFLSEFYRAMVTPSFAENNPQGFVSLFYSLQYILDNVIQQHAVILESLGDLLRN